ADDTPDSANTPDTLYFSSGGKAPVTPFDAPTFDHAPDADHLQVHMTLPAGSGWQYLSVADPGNGQFTLTGVIRSDGVSIPVANFWKTDRTFVGLGRPPVLENNLHLLDSNSTGSYTLVYAPAARPAPTAAIGPVATPRTSAVDQMTITFSAAVTGVT